MFFITKKFGGGCPGHNPELCVGTYFHVCLILKLFVKYPTIWIIWCFFIRIRLCGFDRNDTKEKPPVRHITGHLLNSPSVIINVKSDHLVICWKISNFPFVINRYFVGGDTKTRLISSYFWAFGVGPLSLSSGSFPLSLPCCLTFFFVVTFTISSSHFVKRMFFDALE